MVRYVIVSIVSGLVFGTLDGLINANPAAVRLFDVFKPIARAQINVPAGLVIDLVYGFLLAGFFLLLFPVLPGSNGLVKGLSFGVITWFLRVAMGVLSQWMMYTIPAGTLVYILFTGLGEMLILGVLYGLFLKPV